jgi:hypothetical protein
VNEDAHAPLLCRRCGATLRPGKGDFYVVRIEAVADPYPPDLSLEDFDRLDLEGILREIEGASEQELMDQVYRRLTIHLCGPCYRTWIEDPAG